MTEYEIKMDSKVWDYVILQSRLTDEGAKDFLINEGYPENIEVTQYFEYSEE